MASSHEVDFLLQQTLCKEMRRSDYRNVHKSLFDFPNFHLIFSNYEHFVVFGTHFVVKTFTKTQLDKN